MHIRRRTVLGRGLTFVLTATLTATLAVATATPSAATSHARSAAPPAGMPAASATTSAAPPSTASGTPTNSTSGTAAYTVSKPVYRFLHAGLGLPLAGSRTLRGTKTDSTIKLTIGSPTSVGLPAGVAAPAWGATKIVIDTVAGSLTATSAASGPLPARLDVTIEHAHTSSLPVSDLNATLSITANVVGELVRLNGRLADSAGKPVVALHGTLSQPRVVRTGVLELDSGAAVTLTTATGIALIGTATVGAGVARTPVSVAGTVTDPKTWRLRALPPPTAAPWAPFAGLSVDAGFTGSIVDRAGKVAFDLTSTSPASWTILHSISLAAGRIEFANGAPPQGAPSGTSGDQWLAIAGDLTVPSGAPDDLAATGTVVVDLTTGSATLDATQRGNLTLSSEPAVALHDVALHATLQTGSAAATGTVSGTSAVTVGSATAANATVTLTDQGVLVVDFSGQLAPFGLGAPGATGEILYAAAPIAAYTVPSTGKTVRLAAGFSTTDGAQAGSYTISGSAKQFLDAIGLNLSSATLHGTPSGGTIKTSADTAGRLMTSPAITVPSTATVREAAECQRGPDGTQNADRALLVVVRVAPRQSLHERRGRVWMARTEFFRGAIGHRLQVRFVR